MVRTQPQQVEKKISGPQSLHGPNYLVLEIPVHSTLQTPNSLFYLFLAFSGFSFIFQLALSYIFIENLWFGALNVNTIGKIE